MIVLHVGLLEAEFLLWGETPAVSAIPLVKRRKEKGE